MTVTLRRLFVPLVRPLRAAGIPCPRIVRAEPGANHADDSAPLPDPALCDSIRSAASLFAAACPTAGVSLVTGATPADSLCRLLDDCTDGLLVVPRPADDCPDRLAVSALLLAIHATYSIPLDAGSVARAIVRRYCA